MNLNQTIEAARNVLRFKHMAVKTEKSYVHWIRRFAFWCKDHPEGDHEDKVRAFLTHLARERDVSASTQNQALNAIVFLYKQVLQEDVGDFSGFHPARLPRRLPTVLSRDEVAALLGHLSGMHWMIGALLYGSGLRLAEALSLRVKDVDFGRHIIMVRDGKGAKDRAVMLPSLVIFFIGVFAFIAMAPEAVTQAALAGTWALFLLFIVGEICWLLGRLFLTLL